ncbi:hypothetical protein J8J14_14620 [Roseomonas sp. SSH11]|uniref:Uncharacterized protein n=1 Tax=Pararoseomonas baculiformis TaxID=2820812 RepID=A0ABS4AG46_9PROT|nr:hypothetical protein [Pararoseomonas baculiformis]MBP0446008.1 hypothetical protein [Pararoseomonas baculiformis]
MRPVVLVLSLLAAPAALVPAMAASPAQREAARQVEQDQRQDRVADVARDLETGGAGTPALVDDMNRQRTTLTPDRVVPRAVAPNAPGATSIPLLSDNPQR